MRRRRKGKLVCDATYIAGEVAQGLHLTHLSVKTTLTWIESAIDHLQGASIPTLLVDSQLSLELNRRQRGWCRLIPRPLLERACQRAVSSALADMHGAVAAALVDSYEEWCDLCAAPNMEPAAAA